MGLKNWLSQHKLSVTLTAAYVTTAILDWTSSLYCNHVVGLHESNKAASDKAGHFVLQYGMSVDAAFAIALVGTLIVVYNTVKVWNEKAAKLVCSGYVSYLVADRLFDAFFNNMWLAMAYSHHPPEIDKAFDMMLKLLLHP